MFQNLRVVTLSAVVATLLAGGVSLYAQDPGAGGPRGRGRGGFGHPAGIGLRALDLTDAQRQQVRQMMEQHREQNRALFERVRKAEAARQQAVEAIPVNEAQIRSAMQELGEAQTEMAIQQARLNSEIQTLLTPEQQKKAQELRAAREARMKQRREQRQQQRQDQRRQG
jgi:Spy/CpxP family protein refolding chaperone